MSLTAVRPELYGRLKRIFGDVRIANEGETALTSVPTYDFITGRMQIDDVTSGEYYRVNCFAPETLVATPAGDVPIRELVGSPLLLVPNKKGLGSWQQVEVRAFGRQPLLTIKLRRRGTKKTIRATPAHRWVLSGRNGLYSPATTATLKPGDKLASCFSRSVASYGAKMPKLSVIGIAQGFTFGDGSCEKESRGPAMVRFQTGTKDEAVLPYFGNCRATTIPVSGKLLHQISDLPRSWKQLPDAMESLSFLFGWLSGYFAADGSVSRNGKQATLFSANQANLQFVKGVCYQLGIRVSPILPRKRKSGGCVPDAVNLPLYGVSFPVSDVPLDFWLLRHHRRRVEKWLETSPAKQKSHWTVSAVVDEGDVDEVFCAIVPGVEKFTLADNVLTMNCPYCTDTTKRLWINYRYGQVDATGKIIKHLVRCFNETHCMSVPGNSARLYDDIFAYRPYEPTAAFLTGPPEEDDATPLGPTTLPGECVPIASLGVSHPAVRYLVFDRGYPLSVLSQYDVRVCMQPPSGLERVGGWIILPVYMDRQLVGWQARYPAEMDWKNCGFKKYYNLPAFKKSRALYNWDFAKQHKFIVLVEGVTGPWQMGGPTTACFGMPSRRQLLMLASLGVPICIFLDPGATTEAAAAVEFLLGNGAKAFCAELPPGLDPGSASLEMNWATVRDAAARARIQLLMR